MLLRPGVPMLVYFLNQLVRFCLVTEFLVEASTSNNNVAASNERVNQKGALYNNDGFLHNITRDSLPLEKLKYYFPNDPKYISTENVKKNKTLVSTSLFSKNFNIENDKDLTKNFQHSKHRTKKHKRRKHHHKFRHAKKKKWDKSWQLLSKDDITNPYLLIPEKLQDFHKKLQEKAFGEQYLPQELAYVDKMVQDQPNIPDENEDSNKNKQILTRKKLVQDIIDNFYGKTSSQIQIERDKTFEVSARKEQGSKWLGRDLKYDQSHSETSSLTDLPTRENNWRIGKSNSHPSKINLPEKLQQNLLPKIQSKSYDKKLSVNKSYFQRNQSKMFPESAQFSNGSSLKNSSALDEFNALDTIPFLVHKFPIKKELISSSSRNLKQLSKSIRDYSLKEDKKSVHKNVSFTFSDNPQNDLDDLSISNRIKKSDNNYNQSEWNILKSSHNLSSEKPPETHPENEPLRLLIAKKSPHQNIRIRKSKEIFSENWTFKNNSKTFSSPMTKFSILFNRLETGLKPNDKKSSNTSKPLFNKPQHTPSTNCLLHIDSILANQRNIARITTEEETNERACYSMRDLFLVILMTSLVNLLAAVIITVTFCCLPFRERCFFAYGTRAAASKVQGNLEEDVSGSVGCLEACLPDISYQRHIARGFSKGKAFGMAHMFQQLTGNSSSLESLKWDFKQRKLSRKNSLLISRRSLSLEDLSVVT